MAPAPCLGQAAVLQALGTLFGLLTSPEAASAAILTLSQHKGVTCLAGSIGNHLLLRNSTFQVTLETTEEFCFCLGCSPFAPESLGMAAGQPPHSGSFLHYLQPTRTRDKQSLQPTTASWVLMALDRQSSCQTYFLVFWQEELAHFLRTKYHSMYCLYGKCLLTLYEWVSKSVILFPARQVIYN